MGPVCAHMRVPADTPQALGSPQIPERPQPQSCGVRVTLVTDTGK